MSVFKRWNGTSWETIGPQISSARFDDTNHMIAPEYSSTDTYNVGDYVVQSDKLYKCISAIESAEEWTAAHWSQVSIGEEISDLKGGETSPENISMLPVLNDILLEYTVSDGKYITNYWTEGNNANMSIVTAEIPNGSITLEYTAYDAASSSATQAQFLLDNGAVEVVSPISTEKIANRLYVITCNVPARAQSFKSTIYTSEKSNAYVKIAKNKEYTPEWLKVSNNSITKDSINHNTDSVKTALSVEFEDGYYTGYAGSFTNPLFRNHELNASVSTALISGIEPLHLYELDSYYDVSLSAGGIVVWYDALGNRITDDNKIPYNYVLETNKVNKNKNHFRQIVMSPLNAASAKIAVALTNKTESVFNLVIQSTKQLDWLSVNIRNLDDQCVDMLTKTVLDQIKAESYVYKTIVNKAVSIYGKTVALFGDSIAAGVSSGSTDSGFISWANLFKQRLNLTLSNKAVSGKTITNDNSDSNSISAKVLNYSGTDEIIIIAGGTNDYNQGKTIGTITDNTTATFYGALNLMAAHLKTLAAELVVFITPINCTVYYQNAVATLDDYRKAIQDVCRLNGFSVIEGADFGFPKYSGTMQNLLTYDGLHPTQVGHVMYANEVCNHLFAKEAGGGSGGSISPYTSNPAMDGVASPGTSNNYARGNHVHPTDTSRLAANQGSANAGKFLVVGNDGVIVPVTMAAWQGGNY